MKRNILLFTLLLILSVFLTPIFSKLVVDPYLFPGRSWIVPPSIADFVNAFPYMYLILVALLFGIWGKWKKWLIVGIFALPMLVFAFTTGNRYFAWSLIFFGGAAGVALVVNFFWKKK